MKAQLFSFFLLHAALASGCGGASPDDDARALHVVVVVLDSVRADHVGALGYPRATTPRLDALAAQGLLFERAYAASSFGPQARSALWTGRLPSHGGSIGTAAAPHPSLDTLPRRFRRAGYHTALASNHAELRARTFTRGFDALELDSVPGRWSAERVTSKALDLVDGRGAAPLFLMVDFTDAGEPHLPAAEARARFDVPQPTQLLDLQSLRARAGDHPPDVLEMPAFKDLVARYDAEIATVDRCLGELVDGLAARGILQDTLLVVSSSHGVEFLEHGYVGSGWTLDEEVLRVPLVVLAPGRLEAARIPEPVSLVDLPASLFAVALRVPPDPEPAPRVFLERAEERIRARVPPGGVLAGEVLAEVVLPGLAVLRAAITGQEKRVEVVEWTEPRERLAALAGTRRSTDGGLDPLGLPVRSMTIDLATGRDSPPGPRQDALSAALARYVELCRASAATSVSIEPPADEAEQAVVDGLRQIGYL